MKPIFLAGALILAAAGYAARFAPQPRYPRAEEIQYAQDNALEDAAFLSMGLRRLGADLNFIRLLQYYGRAEENSYVFHEHDEHDGHGGHHAPARPMTAEDIKYNEYYMYGLSSYAGSGFEGGHFPEISRRTLHILSLDPYFSYAALYAAGALAFNLNRADEALAILSYAKQYKPRDWKYDSYMAAIGYSKAGDPAKTADTLDRAVRDPDCPAMLKQQAAFLNKKLGRWQRAYEIYADMYEHSSDPYYVRNAREQMELLRQKI